MENKRIQLKTDTARKGPVFERTKTVLNINSLVADVVGLVKFIMANQNALRAVRGSSSWEEYLDTEPGTRLKKEAHGRELIRARAWWNFCEEFHRELHRESGKMVMGAALMLLASKVEREAGHIFRDPKKKDYGVSPEILQRIHEFIDKNWRELG